MASRAAIEQWAREAVNLALYECALAVADQFARDAKAVQESAAWISPPAEQWVRWQLQRKRCEDAIKPPGGREK